MLKKVVLMTQLLIIGILFNACNLLDREEANPKMDKTFFFENITIREIAGTREKYKIDTFEEKAEDERNNDSLDNLLDSLPLVATVKLDYNNEKNLFKLMKGTFYNLNVDFKTDKAYDSDLGFHLTMQNIDKSDSSSILLDEGIVSDINETGEYSLNIEILMPDDINLSEGKYILLIDIIATDVNRSNEKLDSMEDLKKLQYIGGFYFELEDKDELKTIDIVDRISEKYLDLPIDMIFKDGHTNDFLGKTTLIIYSTVAEETPLNVYGIMEVDGIKYPLRLLDTTDGVIKEKVVLNIPTFDGNNITGGDRDLSYYLDKTSYEAILKKAPDLSTNIDSDGIEGKIIWYITTNNTDIETNDIGESVLISKYLKNFSVEDNFNVEIPTIEKTTNITTSKFNVRSLVSSSSKLINEGILFKYNGGFTKNYGNKKKFSVTFSSNNGVQAKWSLPSVNVKSKSNIYFNIYNKSRVNLLELDIEAGIGIRKTHPNYKTDDDGIRKKAKTRRYGAKATLSIFGLSIAESGNMKEEGITESLDAKDAKEELEKAKEEGKNKKRSLKIPVYKWKEEKTLFEHNFFPVTGLPLEAEFGIAGYFTIKPDFDIVGAGLTYKLETPMVVSSFIRGSLSIYAAKVGVEAKLNMIKTGGKASIGAGLRINDKNELQIVGEGKVKFYLKLINGEFNIFGKIYRPYLWGMDWKKKTWNIYKTPWLYNREWILLDYKEGITILDLEKGI